MLVMIDPRAVRRPGSKVAMGSGAFNLVRREALDRTPGLEHLRLETGDDVALGVMVKRAGGRVAFVDGSRHVSVPMYRSVGGLVRGIEKNGSTLARFPLPVLVGVLLLLWAVVFSPLGALAVGRAWLRLLGATALAAYTAGEVAALFSNTRRWLPALLWPVGGVLMSFALVRSAWLAKRNGGVRWRDTFYSLEELERGRRL
jgi:cellulose synthase/poly-beta-1,6-N-acetylglucosamine synthase-like glycosyltransferase